MNTSLKALTVLLCTISFQVNASPDARSLGMGGTGVASAHGAASPLHNPALLARHASDDRFSLILPTLNVGLVDADDTLTGFQDAQDGSFDKTTQAYENFQMNPTAANGMALGQEVTGLNRDLVKLDKGSFQLDANVLPLSFAVFREKTSWAFFTNASMRMDGLFSYNDQSMLTAYSNILTDGTVTNPEATGNPSIFDGPCVANEQATTQQYEQCLLYPDEAARSTLSAVGLAVAEAGISFAHTLNLGGYDVEVGVTPKYQQVRTYYYQQTANSETSSSELTDYEKAYTTANVDVGFAKTFIGTPWSTGLVIKNMVPQEFDTVADAAGKSYQLKMTPQVTVGGQGKWAHSTLTADLDLTKTDSLAGFGDDTQFLSVGGEFGLRSLNLRLGYRHNLADGEFKGGVTAGLGLGPLALSALYADNAASVALQLGTPF